MACESIAAIAYVYLHHITWVDHLSEGLVKQNIFTGQHMKKRINISAKQQNQYLIYMRVQNFLDLLDEDNKEKTLLLSEELSNVLSYKILRYLSASSSAFHEEDEQHGHMYFFYVKFRRVMKKLQSLEQK